MRIYILYTARKFSNIMSLYKIFGKKHNNNIININWNAIILLFR